MWARPVRSGPLAFKLQGQPSKSTEFVGSHDLVIGNLGRIYVRSTGVGVLRRSASINVKAVVTVVPPPLSSAIFWFFSLPIVLDATLCFFIFGSPTCDTLASSAK